jgi:hypothetical protein
MTYSFDIVFDVQLLDDFIECCDSDHLETLADLSNGTTL